MTILITVLIVAALANFCRCLHFAYTTARDLNDGGYPIYGDAIHNLMFFAFAAMCASKGSSWYSPYQTEIGLFGAGLFALNLWLIGRCRKAGDRAREFRSTTHPEVVPGPPGRHGGDDCVDV